MEELHDYLLDTRQAGRIGVAVLDPARRRLGERLNHAARSHDYVQLTSPASMSRGVPTEYRFRVDSHRIVPSITRVCGASSVWVD